MEEQANLEPLARLEERILETIGQLKAAREAKAQAESEAAVLRQRVAALEAERRQVLERVEKLLAQIDTLTQG